jgi:HMG (high mobility group) box
VIFSNTIREEVRGQNLSFTDIAKLVGERWQKLNPEAKEPFESEANAAKERFNTELVQYKKTESYKEYTRYIADFKVKHSGNTSEGKRPKLESEFAGGPVAGRGSEVVVETRARTSTTHAREVSVGSVSTASYHGSISSPKEGNTGLHRL